MWVHACSDWLDEPTCTCIYMYIHVYIYTYSSKEKDQVQVCIENTPEIYKQLPFPALHNAVFSTKMLHFVLRFVLCLPG